MVKRGKDEFEADEIGLFIPSTVRCLPIWYGSSFWKAKLKAEYKFAAH